MTSPNLTDPLPGTPTDDADGVLATDYIDAQRYLPNAPAVDTVFIDAGHYWSMERPGEVTDAVRRLLTM